MIVLPSVAVSASARSSVSRIEMRVGAGAAAAGTVILDDCQDLMCPTGLHDVNHVVLWKVKVLS